MQIPNLKSKLGYNASNWNYLQKLVILGALPFFLKISFFAYTVFTSHFWVEVVQRIRWTTSTFFSHPSQKVELVQHILWSSSTFFRGFFQPSQNVELVHRIRALSPSTLQQIRWSVEGDNARIRWTTVIQRFVRVEKSAKKGWTT